MKKIAVLIFSVLGFSLFASAQEVKMRDVFADMPDSLMPMVTQNNRLDCIDFIENNLEAKVRNRVDEFVELKTLTDDYLLFQTSEASRVEMKLLPLNDSVQAVCIVRTYLGPVADSSIELYTSSWTLLEAPLAARFNVSAPEVDAFFRQVDAEEDKEAVQTAILNLRDLTLLEACLAPDSQTLTWKIGLGELPADTKKAAQKYVQPVSQSLLR